MLQKIINSDWSIIFVLKFWRNLIRVLSCVSHGHTLFALMLSARFIDMFLVSCFIFFTFVFIFIFRFFFFFCSALQMLLCWSYCSHTDGPECRLCVQSCCARYVVNVLCSLCCTYIHMLCSLCCANYSVLLILC